MASRLRDKPSPERLPLPIKCDAPIKMTAVVVMEVVSINLIQQPIRGGENIARQVCPPVRNH